MKLIDKDRVAAEINRRITDNKKDIERASHKNLEDYFEGYEDALVLLKQQYLDTIETKEVDLEKEVDKIWNPRFNLGWDEKSLLSMNHEGFTTITKYFYELGLKTKGE